jgi:FkbH-like protein
MAFPAQTASSVCMDPVVRGARARHVGVAASFSVAPLEPYLAFWIHSLWSDCVLELAPYGQVLEQLSGPGRVLNRSRDGVVCADVILLRPEDLLRSGDGVVCRDTDALSRARAHVREIARAVASLESPFHVLFVGVVAASLRVEDHPEVNSFDRWTRATIAVAVARAPTTHWLQLDRAAALYDVVEIHDTFRDELAHIPFTDEYMAAVATMITRSLKALWEPPRKAIVLDCDNTLWGGACGEEPIEALEPHGPYALLREFMLEQARGGRLLCLASRNREVDVMAAFARYAAPLTLDQIAAYRIYFGRKSDAVLSLAEELGLSCDDFIFVDDDPVECAEIRAALPEVAVVELPEEVTQIPKILNHVWEFDHLVVTEEDRRRGVSYALEARRRRELDAAPSLKAFVEGLRVRMEMCPLEHDDLARAAQIFARTNQFNLTGARCSAEQLLKLASRVDTDVLVIRVRDRLGDYGLVGVLALRLETWRAHVPLLALSCRVLHRGVEAQIVYEVARRARAGGCAEISIAFRATERNGVARELLERLVDAEGREDAAAGARRYTVRLHDLPARLSRLDPF